MGSTEELLEQAGFTAISVEVKEESREVIAQWMPGSGAEDYVVSANISATKPGGVTAAAEPTSCCAPKLEPTSCCAPTPEPAGHGHGHGQPAPEPAADASG